MPFAVAIVEYARQLSFTLFVLLLLSIVALGVGIERWLLVRRNMHRLKQSTDILLARLKDGGTQAAHVANTTLPKHRATKVFALVLQGPSISQGEVRRALANVIRQAKRRLWLIGTIGSLAPFVGLFGTVLGVIKAFRAIGETGGGGFAVVSTGLSEALVTTAAGIFVGIEAVFLFNLLQIWVADYAAHLKEAAEQVSEAAYAVIGTQVTQFEVPTQAPNV